ncbi:MAG TPA: selenium cofactor biosynthesis protein YqeC [Clostridia bacterium]|nr:selenium cofactor biosynthesis protein YqeC [Clostridia bacterium]
MQTFFCTNESSIVTAFGIPRGITALVGGGGKTTLLLRLAHELAQAGARVIITTTTHIFTPDGIGTHNPATPEEAKALLDREPLICFGTASKEGKLSAPILPMETLAACADYVLIEADGAKRLPLKAPAEHEPVIPNESKLVIAVAGLDGIGRTIGDTAFRADRYAALCGKAQADPVSVDDIALVLGHADGQRKNVPKGARFAVLLNKADDDARKNAALAIATELERFDVERVVIAALGKQ